MGAWNTPSHVPMLCAPLYRGRCCAYSIRAASALRSTKLMSRQTKVAHGATDANITMYL